MNSIAATLNCHCPACPGNPRPDWATTALDQAVDAGSSQVKPGHDNER